MFDHWEGIIQEGLLAPGPTVSPSSSQARSSTGLGGGGGPGVNKCYYAFTPVCNESIMMKGVFRLFVCVLSLCVHT